MSVTLRYAIMSVVVLGLLSHTVSSRAFGPDGIQSDPTTVDAEASKARALRWIDDYREDQVLFHDEDVAGLRKALADGSQEEAQRWWSKTARIRAELESPEWIDTRDWFREFLRVQAIFSVEEIGDLRTRAWNAAGKESSREFRDILAEVKAHRTDLVQGAVDSKAMREYKLSSLAAFRKEQSSGRPVVAKAASFVTNRPPVKPRPSKYAPIRRWGGWRIFLRL
jgi:hypothetical protein